MGVRPLPTVCPTKNMLIKLKSRSNKMWIRGTYTVRWGRRTCTFSAVPPPGAGRGTARTRWCDLLGRVAWINNNNNKLVY